MNDNKGAFDLVVGSDTISNRLLLNPLSKPERM